MRIDLGELSVDERYELLCNTLQPRLIALIETQCEDGTMNSAPFSFFALMGINPPLIAVGITAHADGGDKLTLLNLERTSKASIALVDGSMAPRFDGAPALSLECDLAQVVRAEPGPFASHVALLEIKQLTKHRDFKALVRLEGRTYLDLRTLTKQVITEG